MKSERLRDSKGRFSAPSQFKYDKNGKLRDRYGRFASKATENKIFSIERRDAKGRFRKGFTKRSLRQQLTQEAQIIYLNFPLGSSVVSEDDCVEQIALFGSVFDFDYMYSVKLRCTLEKNVTKNGETITDDDFEAVAPYFKNWRIIATENGKEDMMYEKDELDGDSPSFSEVTYTSDIITYEYDLQLDTKTLEQFARKLYRKIYARIPMIVHTRIILYSAVAIDRDNAIPF